jgi:hypothetical protein
VTAQERAAERERHIQAAMDRTGKTREQVEAFFQIVSHSMGWRSPLSDEEFAKAYSTFLDGEDAELS